MTDMTNEERLTTKLRLAAVGYSPTSALDHLTNDVRVFHLLFGHPAPTKPEMQSRELVERRAKWIRSEVKELEDATTVEEQADAYLDIIYFAIGGLVELGIKFTQRLWRRVQRANIEKINDDGSISKSEAGKVIKPEGWQSPDADLAAMIQEEIHGTPVNEGTQEDSLSAIGDDLVTKLSLASGQHTYIMLFAINGEGQVASTSNMDIANQRDFLRFVTASFASGDVTLDAPEGQTVQ